MVEGLLQDREVLKALVDISKEDIVYGGLIAHLQEIGWPIMLELQANPLYDSVVVDEVHGDALAQIINSPEFEVIKDAVRGSMKQGRSDCEIFDAKVEATVLTDEQKERAKAMFRRSSEIANWFALNVDMEFVHKVWEEQRKFCKNIGDLLEKPIEAAQTLVAGRMHYLTVSLPNKFS